jgi:uncharacterized protein (TIGR02001 family)
MLAPVLFATFLGTAAFAEGEMEAPGETEKKPAELWHAPFGGSFNASFTVTTDYTYAGISANALQPAFQPSLDYRTGNLFDSMSSWLYLTVWGSPAMLPAGAGGEVDVAGGFKFKPFKKLKVDLGYVRVSYPGFAPELAYNYGDFNVNVDYDVGFATVSGRLRFSPDSFGDSGWEFNKRLFVSVPLDFLKISDTVSLKFNSSVGNLSVERYLNYGIPSPDYWYWQFGVVASAYGFSMMVAYTDTNIEPSGCGNTNYCAGRIFAALTKSF